MPWRNIVIFTLCHKKSMILLVAWGYYTNIGKTETQGYSFQAIRPLNLPLFFIVIVKKNSKWCLLFSTFSINAIFFKVNSVQEACAKCFAVHILKFEILQITWKNKKKHQNSRFIDEKLKTKSLMFFVSFFFSCDL